MSDISVMYAVCSLWKISLANVSEYPFGRFFKMKPEYKGIRPIELIFGALTI